MCFIQIIVGERPFFDDATECPGTECPETECPETECPETECPGD